MWETTFLMGMIFLFLYKTEEDVRGNVEIRGGGSCCPNALKNRRQRLRNLRRIFRSRSARRIFRARPANGMKTWRSNNILHRPSPFRTSLRYPLQLDKQLNNHPSQLHSNLRSVSPPSANFRHLEMNKNSLNTNSHCLKEPRFINCSRPMPSRSISPRFRPPPPPPSSPTRTSPWPQLYSVPGTCSEEKLRRMTRVGFRPIHVVRQLSPAETQRSFPPLNRNRPEALQIRPSEREDESRECSSNNFMQSNKTQNSAKKKRNILSPFTKDLKRK